MNRRLAIDILTEYQRYRRGLPFRDWREGEPTPRLPYSSALIGEAIDHAILALERLKGRAVRLNKKAPRKNPGAN